MSITRKDFLKGAATAAATLAVRPALAKGTYDEGASDTEIKIGNTGPYSGPNSSASINCRALGAYFNMINEKGGINGRKITYISYDDAYSPPKTIEQTRKLVESDKVLLMCGNIGSAPMSAVAQYLNDKQIPALFVGSGATKFQDPKVYPWTIAVIPSYVTEGTITGKAMLAANPNAKIGVLYQNDDAGKDYLAGLKKGLGSKVNQIVREEPFETTEPTVDSHIINIKASGADTFYMATVGKFASQGIRKVAELGWKPVFYDASIGIAVESVLKPAGLDNAKGLITTAYQMDPSDKTFANHPDLKEYIAFMDKYAPNEPKNNLSVYGFLVGQLMVDVLQRAGDNLTRKNIMSMATSIQKLRVKMYLPGATITTTPTDYAVVKQFQLAKFDGAEWKLFGDIISG